MCYKINIQYRRSSVYEVLDLRCFVVTSSSPIHLLRKFCSIILIEYVAMRNICWRWQCLHSPVVLRHYYYYVCFLSLVLLFALHYGSQVRKFKRRPFSLADVQMVVPWQSRTLLQILLCSSSVWLCCDFFLLWPTDDQHLYTVFSNFTLSSPVTSIVMLPWQRVQGLCYKHKSSRADTVRSHVIVGTKKALYHLWWTFLQNKERSKLYWLY